MDAKCTQCGKEVDLLTAFTQYKVCGACTRKNHKKTVKGK